MMKKLLILILSATFLMSFGPTAHVNNFSFEVSIDGKPIGTFLVSRTDIDAASTFRVENNTAAGLIRKAEHKSIMLSLYDDNNLISSELKTWVNEKLESSSELNWNGTQYVKKNGEQTMEIDQQLVDYSSVRVFFEEPLDRPTLFYEQYGKELAVRRIASHKYEVQLPNGSKEQYTYQDGEVVMMEVLHTFTTISLIRNS